MEVAREKRVREISSSEMTSEAIPMKATVGIPAYNEEGSIGVLMGRLASEIGSNVVEIVVYDDGSTDGTGAEVLKEAEALKTRKVSFRLIQSKERLGKAAVVWEIIRVAKGDVIVFIDADMRIFPNSVNNILEPFLGNKKIGVVTANILPLKGKSDFFSLASNFQWELIHQLSFKLVSRKLAPKVNGGFFAVRKGVVKHISPNVVSDDEYISWYAQHEGYEVRCAPAAQAAAPDPTNLRDYISKRRRVLGGHYLIRNILHYSVPTTRITIMVPEFGKLAIKHWKNMFYVFVMVFLESGCRLLAFHDAIRMKVSPRYRAVSSKFAFKNQKPKTASV